MPIARGCWSESLNSGWSICINPKNTNAMIKELNNNYIPKYHDCSEFGKGNASIKIYNKIYEYLNQKNINSKKELWNQFCNFDDLPLLIERNFTYNYYIDLIKYLKKNKYTFVNFKSKKIFN